MPQCTKSITLWAFEVTVLDNCSLCLAFSTMNSTLKWVSEAMVSSGRLTPKPEFTNGIVKSLTHFLLSTAEMERYLYQSLNIMVQCLSTAGTRPTHWTSIWTMCSNNFSFYWRSLWLLFILRWLSCFKDCLTFCQKIQTLNLNLTLKGRPHVLSHLVSSCLLPLIWVRVVGQQPQQGNPDTALPSYFYQHLHGCT